VIREPATVVTVSDEAVWVRCDAQQSCPRCARGQGCGGGVFGGLLRSRLRLVRAVGDGRELQAGDRVVIGLAEAALVKAAAAMYLLPLAGIVAGAVIAEIVAAPGEAGIIAGAAAGFGVTLWIVRRYGEQRSADPAFHPRILGRCAAGPVESAAQGAITMPLESGRHGP
jgi:sigma-E factor negative regulatory protein RseC